MSRVLLLTAVFALLVWASRSSDSLRAADDAAADQAPSLADELPRIPPVKPPDVLKTFRLEHGFRLELVAHEPDVVDPVDACFDEDGRMYVAEMRGYPFSSEPRAQQPQGGGKQDGCVIRLLEDTTGDGRYDKSTVFADKISWATSVCCYDGGVFAIAPPHLYYFKDTTGDGKADVRETVYSGFGRENVQSVANNLKWGLDNRIYALTGRNSTDLKHRGEPLISLGQRDFRFDPATEKLEAIAGGQQFGHSMDDWGNRFVCSNSNHILHVVFDSRYLERNPFLAAPGVSRSIGKEGPAAPLFRRSPAEPWRIVRTRRRASDPSFRDRLPATELVATGFFTSATGVTIYRGDAYPAEFRGQAFIGDVGGNLVHRKTLTPDGASFVAVRADQNTEFITSTDNWFRPANFVNAPDGTLYILDMYRETIEHPVSIPEDIKAHLDLESGDDRGRIYRLVPPGWKRTPPPKLGRATTVALVAQLESPNSWNRETAQRLLWERQDRAAVEPLTQLVRQSRLPLARMHALWTLDGLNALTPALVRHALTDRDPHVREHAVRLAERFADSSEIADALLGLADDEAYRVRLQVAFSTGELPDERALEGLIRLARTVGSDAVLRTALLSSVHGRADALAVRLIEDEDFPSHSQAAALMMELGRIIGADDDPAGALRLLAAVTRPEGKLATQRLVLRGLGEGLGRRGASVAKLLSGPAADAQTGRQVLALFAQAAELACDDNRPAAERQAAVGLLAFADFATAARLEDLLTPQTPQALQLAAVQALSQQADAQVGRLLVESWRSYSPKVRGEVLDALLMRAARLDTLFEEVEAGRIKRGEIDRDRKQLLMNHPQENARTQARKLFGDETAASRGEVLAAYQTALDLAGDAARGRQVFAQKCAVCHRVGDEGHAVGPDLTSIQNKSPDALLTEILDPNRDVQGNYTSYTVVTTDGQVFSGIIAAETANSLTLRRAEGKEDVVLRSRIEVLASTGLSLMPEGLEKEITPEQMADLLEFVRSLAPQK